MSERTYDDMLREMLAFETSAAARLRNGSRAERKTLYGEIYDEYARTFQEVLPEEHDEAIRNVGYELAFAKRFVSSDSTVAEIGGGHCALAYALAPHCKSINAIDLTDLSPSESRPSNFRHILTDGFRIPLSDECVDIVISNQVIEHLHPDDAADQLGEILRVLRTGGSYICITPNRLHGPHDISGHYNRMECPIIDGAYIASGLHLKEYTNVELSDLFKVAGFRRIRHFAGARGKYVQVADGILGQCEKRARHVPPNHRKRSKLFRALLGVRIVGDK